MFNLAETTRIALGRRRRASLVTLLTAVLATARQRRQLAEMDADRLNDLGLTPTEALTEAVKPFWDVPNHWLK